MRSDTAPSKKLLSFYSETTANECIPQASSFLLGVVDKCETISEIINEFEKKEG